MVKKCKLGQRNPECREQRGEARASKQAIKKNRQWRGRRKGEEVFLNRNEGHTTSAEDFTLYHKG